MIDLKSQPVKLNNRQAIVNALQYEKKIKELSDVDKSKEYHPRDAINP